MRPEVPENVDLQSQISKFQILSPSNQRLLAQNSTTVEKKQDHKIVRMNTQPSNAKSQQKVTAFDPRVEASPDLVQQPPVPYLPGQMSRDDWKLSESLRSNIDAASQQAASVKVEDLIQRVLLDTVHPIVVNTRKRQSIILDSMRQSSLLEKAFEEFQVQ